MAGAPAAGAPQARRGPRSVLLDDGVLVADLPTRDLLADDALMWAHRLELPFGFDLASSGPA